MVLRPLSLLPWLLAGLCASAAAQPLSLAQAFDRAWQRQPEARATAQRELAAQAQRRAAEAWTPEPAAIEAAWRSDRFHAREGQRELELGIAVPLWLPGERAGSQALADAQAEAGRAQLRLAQWQLAQSLREAWWGLRREREEQLAAQTRAQTAARLADDVARRVRAGELARADQHQAQAAALAAQAELAQTRARALGAEAALRALLGLGAEVPLELADGAEALPADAARLDPLQHPQLQALRGRAGTARSAAALAALQSRGNPELTLLQTRERGARAEAPRSSLTLGLRFPLGRGSQQASRVALAGAEQIEAELQLEREQERLAAAVQGARAALEAAEQVLAATAERARLAAETRDFFDKSFRLGESDLPTRLRTEAEAAIAQRELLRARVDRHQAVAMLNQALGLLPEQL